MSSEANKALVKRFYGEVVNGRDLNLIDDLVGTDFVEHFAARGQPQDKNGLKQFLTMLGTAFPDLQGTVDDMMADGDKVVARLTIRGTHNGPFFGMPATGRPVTWSAIHILRIEGGRIVERWALADVAGIMQQVGASPAT